MTDICNVCSLPSVVIDKYINQLTAAFRENNKDPLQVQEVILGVNRVTFAFDAASASKTRDCIHVDGIDANKAAGIWMQYMEGHALDLTP